MLHMQVRIMGSNYIPGEKKDLYNKSVQRTVLCMGRKQDAVEDVPCGNTVALVGLDAFIQKNATLCDQTSTDAFPIKAMKFSVCLSTMALAHGFTALQRDWQGGSAASSCHRHSMPQS